MKPPNWHQSDRPRGLRVFAWIFYAVGALACATVAADLIAQAVFSSPPMTENRVTRFFDGLVFMYIGSLHSALADERDGEQ